jgi:ABC-type ATPase involved in cell division
LVAFDAVAKRYGERVALRELSFSVGRGEFVLLTGPSGAGKSTVLRLIAALELPHAGQVVVAGVRTDTLAARGRARLRQSLGIVPQDLQLLDDRNVLANVMLPAQVAGLSRGAARERAQAALARVGLDPDTVAQRPRALAGGARQRVALARALVNAPPLLLADAPTAYLDDAAAGELFALLAQCVAGGTTVIVAAHGEAAALPAGARSIALRDGQVVA